MSVVLTSGGELEVAQMIAKLGGLSTSFVWETSTRTTDNPAVEDSMISKYQTEVAYEAAKMSVGSSGTVKSCSPKSPVVGLVFLMYSRKSLRVARVSESVGQADNDGTQTPFPPERYILLCPQEKRSVYQCFNETSRSAARSCAHEDLLFIRSEY
jgi:hypothetical protein